MNLNYSQQGNKRLYSPLLDGKIKKPNIEKPDFKKTPSIKPNNSNININLINFTESMFNIGSVFILSTGGLISILELVSIVRIIYSGSNNYSINLICFAAAFIGTIISMMICLGIVHIIKTIKFIYLNLDEQNLKIDCILRK